MKSGQSVKDTRTRALARASSRAWIAALLGATALSAPFLASPAMAQETQGTTADSNVIIVTAQRRAEALEDVPMTVAVISAETLESAGVTSLRDIQNVTTGFQLGQGGAFPQPAIRGVSTLLNGTFENNVAVYVDGLYQPASQAINIDLPNVESIQVLKGPQGTLYGRNATGGAILLNTITPGEYWEGKAELTYARFDDRRASGYVAGPVSEDVGISLAGYIRRSDGYAKLASRTTPGETMGNAAPLEQDSVRAKVKFDLSGNFTAVLGYNYTHISDPRGNLFTPYENVVPLYGLLPGGETLPEELGVAAYDIGTEIDSKQHEGSLTLEFDTGIGTLRSITGYSQFTAVTSFDFDGSYIPAIWSSSTIRQKTWQQAIDFSISAIENVDLIVGGTYFNDKLRFKEPSVFYIGPAILGAPYDPTTPDSLNNYVTLFTGDYRQDKEAWAVYADATFHLFDRMAINVGGRYSKEQHDVFGVQTGSPALGPITDSANWNEFTPRASIRYEITPRTSIYVSYSKGFRSGTFNSQLTANPADYVPAEPEVVDAFEIGLKSAGSKLRFEAAAFYYDYQDFQVAVTQTGAGGSPVTVIGNAPSAEIYGVEGNFQVELFENFNVRGGAAWLHARYGDDFFFNGNGVDPSRQGINVNDNPLKRYLNVPQIQNLSGLQMSRAPDFTANLGFDFLVPNGDGGFRFAANAKYTDSYVVTNPSVWGPLVEPEFQNQQRFREGNYFLLNASVTWTDPSDKFFVRIFGTNLTDHRYRLHYNGTDSWGTYSPMAEPLTYGMTIGYKFNADRHGGG